MYDKLDLLLTITVIAGIFALVLYIVYDSYKDMKRDDSDDNSSIKK